MSGCGRGLVIISWALMIMLDCLEVKRKSSTAMLELRYLYFDWLDSFTRHHLILLIKIQEEYGLKLGYFQKIYNFSINQVARMACQQ